MEDVRQDDLEDFFENGAVGLHLVGKDGTILRANRAELELLGYTREEYVGRNITEFHADEHVIGNILACLGRGEKLDKYPARLRARDGTIRHVLITSSVLFRDGEFINTRCFTIDVTDRRSAEHALQQSEERLTRLLHLTPVGIAEIAPSGAIVYANAAAERILRLKRSEIESRRYDSPEWAVTTPEGHAIPRDDLPPARAMRGEMVVDHEVAVVGAEGYRVIISVSAMPLRDADQSVRAVLIAFADVTGRHEAEKALRESEERFRTLANNIPQLAWMAEADGWIFWFNHRWYEYTGTSPEQMEGWGWQSVHARETLPGVLERWRASIGTGEPFDMVFPLKGADGLFRPFLTRVAPIRDAAGSIVRWFGTNTDISEQRRIEEALRASEEGLHRLNDTLERRVQEEVTAREQAQMSLFQAQKLEAIGQLTGGVAHDFNNLLTAIIGNLDLLNSDHLNERSRRLVATATRSAERGAKLTEQLLAYARRQHLIWQPVDINKVVHGLDDMLRRTLGGLVHIDTRLAPELWHASSDPTQLELAILNLAINARDAMPLGSGTLQIETQNVRISEGEVSDLRPGDYVHIAVSDTGMGMTPDVIEKAMDPFFTTKEVGKGSGLGLSQVYGVVKQCGGAIRLESAIGKGTTVRIWLPRVEAGPEEPPRGEVWSRPHSGIRRTLLVVDDEADVRTVAVEILKEAGYRVEEAASGAEALAILDDRVPIELAVVDYAMPRMSGIEFVRAARERRLDLPVVYITGYADPQEVAIDGDAIIVRKPYRAAELVRTIEATFERHLRSREAANVIALHPIPAAHGPRS
jgi:PAS domain S-box-containing protein